MSRAGGPGRGDAVRGEYGQHAAPLVVGHVQAVVDDRRALTGPPGRIEVGAVGRHDLRLVRKAPARAPAHGTNGVPAVGELGHDGPPGPAGGTEDDVRRLVK